MDYKENIRIDLHIHSTASDGTSTPSEIITMAQEFGLGAIAITDHDTLAGSKEALGLSRPAAIEFITKIFKCLDAGIDVVLKADRDGRPVGFGRCLVIGQMCHLGADV